MKKIFFLLLIGLYSINLFSQAPEQDITISKSENEMDIRIPINKVLYKNADLSLLYKTPKNEVYLFMIALSFNSEGKIEEVFFSKDASRQTKAVFKFDDNLKEKIKSLNMTVKKYAENVIMYPILFKWLRSTNVELNPRFFMDFNNMFPYIDGNKAKQTMFLKPYVDTFFEEQ